MSKTHLPEGTRKFILNITPDLLAKVDNFAQTRTFNRATAVRTLLSLALEYIASQQKGN
jgi:metal-responsive CopG/Arc/MetJ family transcriptional regulator